MLLIADAQENNRYSDLFGQMYRMRARQFSQWRRWLVQVMNGLAKYRLEKLRVNNMQLDHSSLNSLRFCGTVVKIIQGESGSPEKTMTKALFIVSSAIQHHRDTACHKQRMHREVI
ncbi:MAG: hypothetical protein COC24_017485 [Alphaproteobacteria bacterium]|nr:hypothetical protein [Alphaproteobacteria bacterium]